DRREVEIEPEREPHPLDAAMRSRLVLSPGSDQDSIVGWLRCDHYDWQPLIVEQTLDDACPAAKHPIRSASPRQYVRPRRAHLDPYRHGALGTFSALAPLAPLDAPSALGDAAHVHRAAQR